MREENDEIADIGCTGLAQSSERLAFSECNPDWASWLGMGAAIRVGAKDNCPAPGRAQALPGEILNGQALAVPLPPVGARPKK